MNSTNEAILIRVVKELFEEYTKEGMSIPEANEHIQCLVNGGIDQHKAQKYFYMVGLKKGSVKHE